MQHHIMLYAKLINIPQNDTFSCYVFGQHRAIKKRK